VSDTPRTDSNLCRYEHPAWPNGRLFTINDNAVVLANFARQLERELAEAIAQRDELLTAAEKWFKVWNTAYGWDFDKAKEMEKLIIKLKEQNHE
jgi:hypothetical protein